MSLFLGEGEGTCPGAMLGTCSAPGEVLFGGQRYCLSCAAELAAWLQGLLQELDIPDDALAQPCGGCGAGPGEADSDECPVKSEEING